MDCFCNFVSLSSATIVVAVHITDFDTRFLKRGHEYI